MTHPPAAPCATRSTLRRRWPAAVLLALLIVVLQATEALAAWTAPSAGSAQARSQAMPSGPAPTATVQGRNVMVSWPARTLAGGEAVSGYQVRRLTAGGAIATIGAACSTLQTGLTCTEAAVAPGSWSYGITPVLAQWTGAEGTRTTATVGAPSFTRTSAATVSSLPSTVTGIVASYVGPANLTFRLDDAATGTILTGTPTTVAASGTTNVSVILPTGVAAGSHTIYAIGNGTATDAVGIAILVDTTRPSPTAVVTTNGGATAGKAEQGDYFMVTFSEPLAASSICSAWADDGTAKSLTTGVTVTLDNKGGTGSSDLISVSASGCGAGGFHLGSLDLGAKGFVKGGTDATFGATGTSSTIGWNPATATLTVVFGTASSNTYGTVASSTAVYTPDATLTDLAGLLVTGSASSTARQL